MPHDIHIVTPAFNSARTLRQTLYSVAHQAGRFRLHHHVQDGGSTDGTVGLLTDWAGRVARGEIDSFCEHYAFTFESAPDKGMYDAIHRAFEGCGAGAEDWLGWINADDRLAPGALALLAAIDDAGLQTAVDWVGGTVSVVRDELVVACGDRPLSADLIAEGVCDGTHWNFVQQEGTFFRRRVWDSANPAKTFAPFRYAGDWNLWRMFAKKRHRLHQVRWPLGTFTRIEGQLSQIHRDAYLAEIDRTVPRRVRAARLLSFRSRGVVRDLVTTHMAEPAIQVVSRPMSLEPWLGIVAEADAAAVAAVDIAPPDRDPAVVVKPGLVAYDADWQFPAITEKHAYHQVAKLVPPVEGVCYLAFPWATLIDLLQTGGARAIELKARLRSLKPLLAGYRRVVTVCQHIYAGRYVDLLLAAGVTDVFWSHACHGVPMPGAKSLQVRPFPLYPVQVPPTAIPADGTPRRHLFSFVGAKANPDFYLTDVRTLILEELSGTPGAVVRARDAWHYEKVVYDHQILGRSKTADAMINEDWSAEFRDLLLDSTFTLCPSGSGPNSIRLWEALEAGSIPVVLADSWAPPGDPVEWDVAVVYCRETREAIRELPARLAAIARNPSMLEKKRTAMRRLRAKFGRDVFVHDIRELYRQLGGGAVAAPPGRAAADAPGWLQARALDIAQGRARAAERRLFVISCTSRLLTDPAAFVRLCAESDALRDALRSQLADDAPEHVALCRAALTRLARERPEIHDWFLRPAASAPAA